MQHINYSANFLYGSYINSNTMSERDNLNDLLDFSNDSHDKSATWNNTGGFYNPFQRTYFRVLFIVIYSVIFTLCIIGNCMVLFAIARSPRLRRMTNFLLANLAIADLSVGVCCVLPNLFIFLQPNWILGRAMCKIYYFIWNVSYIASILVLTVIAVERHIAILHPLKARRFMINHRFRFVQMTIWAIALMYNIPILVFYDIVSFNESETEYCYATFDHMESLKWLSLANLIFWYIVPLMIIGVLYFRVVKLLWKTTVVSALRLLPYPEADEIPVSRNSSRMTHLNQESVQKISALKYDKTHPTVPTIGNIAQSSSSSSNGENRIENKAIFTFNETVTVVCRFRPRDEQFLPSSTSSKDGEARVTLSFSDSRKEVSPCSFRHSRYRQTCLSSSRRVTKARKNVIRLLICIVICFGVCVLPHMIQVLNHFWVMYVIPHSVNTILSPVAFIVLYLKSVLNPFLYAANFRRCFKETMFCFRKRDKSNAMEVK